MLENWYMRPRKAALLAEAIDRYEDLSGRLGVACHDEVTLVPLGQMPGVAPESGLLIDDCDFCSRITPGLAERVPHFPGVTLYGGWLRKAWGHFLMNSTARLWPCFVGERIDRIVFFSDSPDMFPLKDNYREFFALAGLLDKIEIISGEAVFERLLVPDISLEGGMALSREFLLPFMAVREEALRSGALSAAAGRLLLARSRWKNNDRIQLNSSFTERIFAAGGFTPVSPESVGLAELVRLMNGAEEVASFSGSTAHNLLFCAPGARFVSIERAAANNMYQAAIFRLLDVRATPVDAFWQPLLVSSTDISPSTDSRPSSAASCPHADGRSAGPAHRQAGNSDTICASAAAITAMRRHSTSGRPLSFPP